MSKNLFSLIKKMSPNEKGYFKKSSQIHVLGDQNVYIRLFNLLDKQKKYDKEKINTAFNDKKIISQLHVLGNYLYHLILKTLKTYHSDKTVKSKIKNLITDAEQLYGKGLYEQATEAISKAHIKAEKHEDFLLMLEIFNMEEKIAIAFIDLKYLKRQMGSFYNQKMAVVEKLKNVYEYSWLEAHMAYMTKTSGRYLKSDKDIEQLEELMKNKLLTDRSLPLSLTAKNSFLLLNGHYNAIKKNPQIPQAIKYNLERLKLMESNLHWVSLTPGIYISLLNNLILNAGETFDLKLYSLMLDKLNAIPEFFKIKLTEEEENYRKALYVKYSIYQSFISCDFERGVEFVRNKEKEYFELMKNRNTEEVLVHCNNMYFLYFGIGDYRKALYWINKFFSENEDNIRRNMLVDAFIWNIIIHYELKNYDLADSLVKSNTRYLKKYPKEFFFEKAFNNDISLLIRNASLGKTDSEMKVLKKLQLKIESYKDSGLESDRESLYLQTWLRSKIEKRPFTEILIINMKKLR